MKQSISAILKKATLMTSVFLLLAGTSHAASAKLANQSKKLTAPSAAQVSRHVLVKKKGIDPAVTQLQVTKSGNGTLSIRATVKNIGTEDFVSGPNQAAVVLQVYNPRMSGPSAYTTLATRKFTHLSTDGSIVVDALYGLPSFVEWADDSLDFGECHASREVIAMISYDPDILMDSNPGNDDIQNTNNMKKQNVTFIVECPW